MTLDQLISRLRKPPPAGAHEIVRGPDGTNHLVVITHIADVGSAGGTVREYGFHSWCNRGDLKSNELEVVREESITCVICIQWRST